MTPKEALKHFFNYDEFRPFQEEIIDTIIEGNNVLAILPTGGGKSLCYQIPALIADGFSLVISPLIALMKDQVDSINSIEPVAAFINSSQSFPETEKILNDVAFGKLKMLYVAPEKLENRYFIDRLKHIKPEYIFIDEAHCISEWGHNFRPSYRRINEFCEFLEVEKLSAFTATAVPEVRKDIIAELDLKSPRLFIKGFERPNLHLNVIKTRNKKEKVLELLKRFPSPAIIYTSTRKNAESVAEFLLANHLQAHYYHAGLQNEKRRVIQDDFLSDRVKIIVATNAFGMGIDKQDIRLIIHFNMPGTIESYYQEIGRAGRDGNDSKVFLLYEPRDRSIQEFLIEQNYPKREDVEKVYNTVCNFASVALGSMTDKYIPIGQEFLKLCQINDIPYAKVMKALEVLQQSKYLQIIPEMALKHYAKVAISREDLRRFIDGLNNFEIKDLLLWILRLYGNNVFVQTTPINIEAMSKEMEKPFRKIISLLEKLNQLGIIDYEEPSGKPSIKLTAARCDARYLQLNDERVEELISNSRNKLQTMVDFCHSDSCRFNFILRYFGQVSNGYKCETCDNCTGEDHNNYVTDEYLKDIILNTVHEAKIPIKKKDLVKVLVGDSDHPSLRKFTNFGICKHFSQEILSVRIDELADLGFLKQFNGTVVLDEKGKDEFCAIDDFINGEKGNDFAENLELFNKLKEARDTAARRYSQSYFVICPDEILREIAKTSPKSPSNLLSISGFNQRMFNKIGEDFLEIINQFGENVAPEENEAQKELPITLKETFILIQKGYPLSEISSITKLPEAVVSMQIESIVSYYPDLDITKLYNRGELDIISEEIHKGGTDLKELKSRLPSFISYGKIRIALAKMKAT